jgi:hypothetical protein
VVQTKLQNCVGKCSKKYVGNKYLGSEEYTEKIKGSEHRDIPSKYAKWYKSAVGKGTLDQIAMD